MNFEHPSEPTKSAQVAMMEKARAASSFDSFALSCVIYGSVERVHQRRAAYKRVEVKLDTRDTSVLPRCYGNANREQAYEEGLEMGNVAFLDGLTHDHDFFDEITPRGILGNASPIGLNKMLFEPAIRLCGSEEQRSEWLPLVDQGKIIGTYCQTELGHGTFIRGIETTATLDTANDEFIIHSPTVSSTKFWPGGLGFSSTHAVVMARLLIGSQNLGPHMFIVQLRFVEDGKVLPGIKLGDVGLKMAYNGTDNGFARFTHVRVPRKNMLMRYTKVSPDGTYSAVPNHAVLTYATMLKGRIMVARVAASQLAQATVIATRYSTVREQSAGSTGKLSTEVPIMHYKHQHFRLLTLIAKSYAMLFATKSGEEEYQTMLRKQGHGDHSSLSYLHCFTAGLKAWVTGEAADGAEDARKCCGGHGFLMISGLPDLVASTTGAATFEGENYVLWLQVGRHLLKCLDALLSGQDVPPSTTYLAKSSVSKQSSRVIDTLLFGTCTAQGNEFLDRDTQLDMYRHRARHLVHAVHAAVRSSKKQAEEAWNEHSLSIIAAARAHIEYTVLLAFTTHLTRLHTTIPAPLYRVLNTLCSLFALSSIIHPRATDALALNEDAYLSPAQLSSIRALVDGLLQELLPEAVALTDAWEFTDAGLCSALGMWDGDVYKNVMRWVEQLPINVRAWGERKGGYTAGWERWIDPILKAKL